MIAVIDGERFEVWPENGGGPVVHAPAAALPVAAAPSARSARPAGPVQTASTKMTPAPVTSALAGTVVKAPIPGVIVAIDVKPGDAVKVGEQLCTLEAMKMKNSIRATREGVIAEVHITVGQTVNHNAALISFTE